MEKRDDVEEREDKARRRVNAPLAARRASAMRTAARSWPMSFLAGPGLVVSSSNRFTGSTVRGHGPAGHLRSNSS